MKSTYICIVMLTCLLTGYAASAQTYTNNPISQYYRHGYLWNGAYAGASKKPVLYGLANRSWIGFDGAPTVITFAGDLGFSTHSGAGVLVSSNKAGALQRVNARFNYSYRLDFSETQKLRMGVGLNTYRERLNMAAMGSDGAIDPAVRAFNEKGVYIDGEFGAVYENKKFTFAGSLMNLRRAVQKESIRPSDLPIFQLMASYSFAAEENINLKPLASFKHFINQKNLFAGGLQMEYEKVFHASLLYQSTGSVLGMLGVTVKDMGELNIGYGSNNKDGYGQQWEVGLLFRLK
ncbi:MAG: PorP/SprF family type IX secretion system membrane protein [Chitinophagaceae bacterium]